jgi:hypothetical protein
MRLRRRRHPAVDSHDVGVLRAVSIRTRLLRIVLAAAAVGALAAAAASARNLDVRERSILPSGSTGVVVLDLSLSIAEGAYGDLRRTLRRLIAADAPIGLVVFSDVPYELLPPGTPARELQPLLRLLVPPRTGPSVNPWAGSFRSGTRISTALRLAEEMLDRDEVDNGSVLLVSDLQTAPEDYAALTGTLERLKSRSIAVRVVPISALSDGRRIFEGVLGADTYAAPDDTRGADPGALRRESGSDLPVVLLVLGGLLFIALAAHERFASRLALPRGRYA